VTHYEPIGFGVREAVVRLSRTLSLSALALATRWAFGAYPPNDVRDALLREFREIADPSPSDAEHKETR
jgi:hypothetical protein